MNFPYERFLLRSKLCVYKKRLSRSKIIINEALGMGLDWYVACSAGKDSDVLAHMVNIISSGIEVWSEKDCFDYPDEREYLGDLAKRYRWKLNIVFPEGDLTAAIKKINICEDLHSRGTTFSDEHFYKLIYEQEQRFDGVFLGLRNEESKGRLMNFKVRGHIYQRKNNKWTCNPLATWEAEDVFAYLVSNNIPILSVYFKTKFHDGDPCKIRKAWYLPSSRSTDGHCVWLKYYYPELYYKLLDIAPEVGNYV